MQQAARRPLQCAVGRLQLARIALVAPGLGAPTTRLAMRDRRDTVQRVRRDGALKPGWEGGEVGEGGESAARGQ